MVKTGLVEAIDSLVPLDEHFATFRGNGYSRKDQKESQKQTNPSTEWKGQSQKSSQVKKIQLEGLKLPKPQVILQKKKTRVKIAKKVEITFKLYNLRGPICLLPQKSLLSRPKNPVTTERFIVLYLDAFSALLVPLRAVYSSWPLPPV
ncbi:hypothetical protein Tco_1320063 [Tanacetum coccineum]